MKKTLLSLLMTGALLLNLGSSLVMAEENGNDGEMTSVTTYVDSVPLNKAYKLLNDGTVSPAETFNFTIENVGVEFSQYSGTDFPTPTLAPATITFAEGEATASGDTNLTAINLPTYGHVGVFTYLIQETKPSTPIAGVVYDEKPLYLKVTVVEDGGFKRVAAFHYATEDGTKTGSFNNSFEAGKLTLAKTVTGNMGEKDRYFDVTVTLTAPAKTNIGTVPVSYTGGKYLNNEDITFTDGVATLKLQIRDGDTLTFQNLPYDVSYVIAEDNYSGADDGYTTTYTEKTGTIAAASQAATILNHREQEIDTGISLESMPYIILIGLAVSGLAFFALKRRRREES